MERLNTIMQRYSIDENMGRKWVDGWMDRERWKQVKMDDRIMEQKDEGWIEEYRERMEGGGREALVWDQLEFMKSHVK